MRELRYMKFRWPSPQHKLLITFIIGLFRIVGFLVALVKVLRRELWRRAFGLSNLDFIVRIVVRLAIVIRVVFGAAVVFLQFLSNSVNPLHFARLLWLGSGANEFVDPTFLLSLCVHKLLHEHVEHVGMTDEASELVICAVGFFAKFRPTCGGDEIGFCKSDPLSRFRRNQLPCRSGSNGVWQLWLPRGLHFARRRHLIWWDVEVVLSVMGFVITVRLSIDVRSLAPNIFTRTHDVWISSQLHLDRCLGREALTQQSVLKLPEPL